MNSLLSTGSIRFLLLLGIIFIGSGAKAQLDSVSVSSVTASDTIIVDSLTSTSDSLTNLDVEVYMDDIDFMGEVIVVVYDDGADYPLAMIKHTKAELESYGSISGSIATIEFVALPDASTQYRVEIQARNFQGGNLPIVSTLY